MSPWSATMYTWIVTSSRFAGGGEDRIGEERVASSLSSTVRTSAEGPEMALKNQLQLHLHRADDSPDRLVKPRFARSYLLLRLRRQILEKMRHIVLPFPWTLRAVLVTGKHFAGL